MGAYMLLYTVPAAEITPPRKTRLIDIANRFTIRELREWLEEDFGTTRQTILAEIHDAIDVLAVAHELRASCRLYFPGMPYPLFVTGGLSWGDEPTELARPFELLSRCTPLDRQLVTWATDDLRDCISTGMLHAPEISVRKRGIRFCVDVPDPTSLGTDDERWTNVGRFDSRSAALEFIREHIGPCDDAGRITLISAVEELPPSKPTRPRRKK